MTNKLLYVMTSCHRLYRKFGLRFSCFWCSSTWSKRSERKFDRISWFEDFPSDLRKIFINFAFLFWHLLRSWFVLNRQPVTVHRLGKFKRLSETAVRELGTKASHAWNGVAPMRNRQSHDWRLSCPCHVEQMFQSNINQLLCSTLEPNMNYERSVISLTTNIKWNTLSTFK